jgi:precorrin-2 dehydrogenase/sirohydrochlorin ferrochelatase
MKQFPVMLDLNGRLVLVVGGGKIAEAKISSLLETGANITIMSPSLTNDLSTLAAQGKISYTARTFEDKDLDNCWLVIAATNDSDTNEQVYRAAEARRIFCNVVDYRPLCSFVTPAIVERGDITVAISTSGGSPALAQELKRVITEAIGEEYVQLLEILRDLRSDVRAKVTDQARRSLIFHKIVESDALALLKAKKRREAEALAQQIIDGLSP